MPVASDRQEERKDEEDDLEDLEEESSGGDPGAISMATVWTEDMAMFKEWTRGRRPASIVIGRVVRAE